MVWSLRSIIPFNLVDLLVCISLQYQVERKLLEPHRELVQSVTTNLPRFIDYMKLRTAKS